MSVLNMVYDRTALDVYAGNEKGQYRASDLNRVENAVSYLADLLENLQDDLKTYSESLDVAWDETYDVPYDPSDYAGIVVKTDWLESDLPLNTTMTRYLQNVVLLKSAFVFVTAVLPSSMNGLNYAGANAIEKVLTDLENKIIDFQNERENTFESISQAWFYCGDLISGEI